jgi:hypothetical protein
MKNIHLIPTDNYSQLVNSTSKYGGLFLSKYYSPMKDMGDSYQNIYITSDEEIKEGDWCYDDFLKSVFQANSIMGVKTQNTSKKIILTTDQDLIKDGVQAIDDEFLEWFVKNPSCEWVEVKEKQHFEADKSKRINPLNGVYYSYKIIIPQEEPKQDLEKEMFELEQELDIPSSMRWHNSKPKQEIDMSKYISGIDPYDTQATLEEVAKSEAFEFSVDYKPWETDLDYREYAEYGFEKGFIEGTKYQAERMYSEEDLRKAFSGGRTVYNYKGEWEETYNDNMTSSKFENFDKWFEQFKKK